MKKIFKYGCGLLGLINLLFPVMTWGGDYTNYHEIKQTDQKKNNVSNANNVKFISDMLQQWPKVSPGKFFKNSASEHMKTFLKQQGVKIGYDPQKEVFCLTATAAFSEKEYCNIKAFRHKIELNAFVHALAKYSDFLHNEMSVKGDEFYISSSMPWAGFHLEHKITDTKEIISFSKENELLVLYHFNKDKEHIYVKSIHMCRCSAYDHFICHWLKFNPNRLKLEYSAWSWDDKKKQGEFALALVLDISSFKKAK